MKNSTNKVSSAIVAFLLIFSSVIYSCNKEENEVKKPQASLEEQLENDKAFLDYMVTGAEVLQQYSNKINGLSAARKAELMKLVNAEATRENGEKVLNILGLHGSEREEFSKLNNKLYEENQKLNNKYPELASMQVTAKRSLFEKLSNNPTINTSVMRTLANAGNESARVLVTCTECRRRYDVCAAQVAGSFAAMIAGCLVLPFPLNAICAAGVGIERNAAMNQCGQQLRDCQASCTR